MFYSFKEIVYYYYSLTIFAAYHCDSNLLYLKDYLITFSSCLRLTEYPPTIHILVTSCWTVLTIKLVYIYLVEIYIKTLIYYYIFNLIMFNFYINRIYTLFKFINKLSYTVILFIRYSLKPLGYLCLFISFDRILPTNTHSVKNGWYVLTRTSLIALLLSHKSQDLAALVSFQHLSYHR
jgi:hypothetical protein